MNILTRALRTVMGALTDSELRGFRAVEFSTHPTRGIVTIRLYVDPERLASGPQTASDSVYLDADQIRGLLAQEAYAFADAQKP